MQQVPEIPAGFWQMIFPVACLGCDAPLSKGEATICTVCHASLPVIDHSVDGYLLSEKLRAQFPYQHIWAYVYFRRKDRIQKLLHRLKYENHPEVGLVLGKWFGETLVAQGQKGAFDWVIPVPLHPHKRRIRGYNQSMALAEGLAEVLESTASDTLVGRIKNTATQTRKSKSERQVNMESAFEVMATEQIRGKHILLVDDVVTTGATLESCARAIEKAHPSSISVALLADAGLSL